MGIPTPISAHNEPLVGDTLTTVQFNYEWRRLVAELLWPMTFDGFWSGSAADVTDAVSKARAMIEDLYTLEPIGADMDYLGVMVARNTDQTATPVGVLAVLELDTGFPLHDVGDFWDVAVPNNLVVPVGGAGYYHCHASAQFAAGVANPVLRLFRGAINIIGVASSPDTTQHQLNCAGVALFNDGEKLNCEIRNTGGNRNVHADTFSPFSVRVGMYRVGLAP